MKKVFVILNYEDGGPTCPLKAFSTYQSALEFIENNNGLYIQGYVIGEETVISELNIED